VNDKLRLVCATRLSRERFWEESLLGRSLTSFPDKYLPELAIQFDNEDAPTCDDPSCAPRRAEGLSSFYNRVIASTNEDTNLLFIHDDVFLHDVFLKARLQEAFRRFDVVGLAGSRGGNLEMPSWGLAFHPDTLEFIGWQGCPIHLSGAVGHLQGDGAAQIPPDPLMSVYGPSPDFCTLLDGLFIAVRTRKLKETGVRFDKRFRFHLYDIDFCRQATEAGILMGTWPILVTHGSGGNFASEAFRAEARAYLEKWTEASPIELSQPKQRSEPLPSFPQEHP
jgi:hypothetical protein